MKNHSRSHSRKMNIKHALRKQKISREVFGYEYYDNLHQYSHNKIHCSCPLCRNKSWSLGNNSDAQKSMKDQRRINSMTEQLAEA